MDSIAPLAQRMPYTTAFPKALGTGLLISTPHPITAELRGEMERFIDEYEHAVSRFRADSLVAHIGNAEHGGHFDFPDWAGPLFDLYDALHAATRGAIDPCVGEDLIRLGYDPALSFTVEADAGERLGALHGRAVWGRDVVRSGGTTLVTHGPVHLDFGACGKGYLVDLLGGLLDTFPEFVIDAGGDLLAHTSIPIRVALEDPEDSSARWAWQRFAMARSARARPVVAIGRWRLTSGRIWRSITCSTPSTDYPRSRRRPHGWRCEQTRHRHVLNREFQVGTSGTSIRQPA